MRRCSNPSRHHLSDHDPKFLSEEVHSSPGVVRLVAAALDECALCVVSARTDAIQGGSSSNDLAGILTAWLSETAARAEASGASLPETAVGVVRDARLSHPTQLLLRLVELAGPAKPSGRARVLRQDVFRAMQMFPKSDRPTFFDDALDQLRALARVA